ncbi:hypothetical protein D3C85_1031690 [compost metagenome]
MVIGEQTHQRAARNIVVHGVVIQERNAFAQQRQFQQRNAVVGHVARLDQHFFDGFVLLEAPAGLIARQQVGQTIVLRDIRGQRGRGPLGEIRGRGHQETFALEQDAPLQARFHGRRNTEIDIEVVAAQVCLGFGQHQFNMDVGVLLAKGGNQRRQHAQAEHHARMHPQYALGRGADFGDVAMRLVDVPQDGFKLLRVFLAGFGQHDLAGGTQQQLHVQLVFELGDHAGHRRCRHPELPSGFRETLGLGDR